MIKNQRVKVKESGRVESEMGITGVGNDLPNWLKDPKSWEANTKNWKESDWNDIAVITEMYYGNTSAFNDIVKKYMSRISFLVLKYVYDQSFAKDVTITIFEKAYFKINKYEPQFTFNAWLSKLAYHMIIDSLRSRQNNPEYSKSISLNKETINDDGNSVGTVEGILGTDEFSPEKEFQRQEDSTKVTEILSRIDVQDADFLKMIYMDGYTYEEVARKYRTSASLIKVRVFRAKAELAKVIAKDYLYMLPDGLKQEVRNIEIERREKEAKAQEEAQKIQNLQDMFYSNLHKDEADLMRLYYIKKKSLKELAVRYKVSVAMVRSWIQKCKEFLPKENELSLVVVGLN